jgi:hypothetical protein
VKAKHYRACPSSLFAALKKKFTLDTQIYGADTKFSESQEDQSANRYA